jgi:hypothetical protein
LTIADLVFGQVSGATAILPGDTWDGKIDEPASEPKTKRQSASAIKNWKLLTAMKN